MKFKKLHANITLTIFNGKNSIFYRSNNLWNKLPNELVLYENIDKFCHNLRKFDLDKVSVSKIFK